MFFSLSAWKGIRDKDALKRTELSKLKIDEDYYYLKGKTPELGKKILNVLRVKHIPNFFKEWSDNQIT